MSLSGVCVVCHARHTTHMPPSIHYLLIAVSVVGKMHRSTSDVDLNQYNG
jgi:hypothetical protein